MLGQLERKNMIRKMYSVKDVDDFNELSEKDTEQMKDQYMEWLTQCPFWFSTSVPEKVDSSPFPHKKVILEVHYPVVKKEDGLKRYDVHYEAVVDGFIDIEARDLDHAYEVAEDHYGEFISNVESYDYEIEVLDIKEL